MVTQQHIAAAMNALVVFVHEYKHPTCLHSSAAVMATRYCSNSSLSCMQGHGKVHSMGLRCNFCIQAIFPSAVGGNSSQNMQVMQGNRNPARDSHTAPLAHAAVDTSCSWAPQFSCLLLWLPACLHVAVPCAQLFKPAAAYLSCLSCQDPLFSCLPADSPDKLNQLLPV